MMLLTTEGSHSYLVANSKFLHVKTKSICLIIIGIIHHSTTQLHHFNKAGHIYVIWAYRQLFHSRWQVLSSPRMAIVMAQGLFLSPLPFLWLFNLPSAQRQQGVIFSNKATRGDHVISHLKNFFSLAPHFLTEASIPVPDS